MAQAMDVGRVVDVCEFANALPRLAERWSPFTRGTPDHIDAQADPCVVDQYSDGLTVQRNNSCASLGVSKPECLAPQVNILP